MRRPRPPRALAIAGSDSSGGAGIQADLATFAALGVFGAAAVTAITVQDTRGVLSSSTLSPALVAAQIDAVLGDGGADAVKIGMLGRAGVVEAVASALARRRVRNLVVDPVIRSTSGAELLDRSGIEALRRRILPMARIVTPNLAEAALLSGLAVTDVDSAAEACRRILRLGVESVVVTGGHLRGEPVDVLADGRQVRRLRGRRVGEGAHGTGCVFSSAITAYLARGRALEDAVRAAKRFVAARIARARRLGRGEPVLDLRASVGSSRSRGG